MRRILCLHLPYLSTERAWRDSASAVDHGRPLALTRPVGSSLVVEDVCPHARRLGVRPGWSLAQAQGLVPELATLTYDPQRDQVALEQLAGWGQRFSPLVEPVPPNTLLVDVTGCQRLFGGEEPIARQAVAGLRQQGFHARAAIADTVGAAYALAVAGDEPLLIAPPGQTSAYLAPLPPAALRLNPPAGERLEALGIRTIGDLLTLPRAALPARFGSQLVLRLQQALGEVFEGVTPYQPPEVPRAYQSFETPVTDWPVLLAVAGGLLTKLLGQLQRRAAALRRLEGLVYYEQAAPLVVTIGLARASRAHRHVLELLTERLERVDLTPGVTGLMLVARETSHWPGGQGELFESREPGDDEALGCLVDRLAGRLGWEAVVRPQLVDDHQPEMAFRWVSVSEAGCAPLIRDSHLFLPMEIGGCPYFRRPVRLLARPVPIRVIALVPDGPPTWFWYHGREHVVAQADGPERLETAWWRGPDIRRDYFVITAKTGEQFWVFRAVSERRWYVHGIFA